jgi:hypothetical protein
MAAHRGRGRARRRPGRRSFGALVMAGAGLEVGRQLGRLIWKVGVVLGWMFILGIFAVVAYMVYVVAHVVPPEQRLSATIAVAAILIVNLVTAYCLLRSQWWTRNRGKVGAVMTVLAGVGALVFTLIQAKGI